MKSRNRESRIAEATGAATADYQALVRVENWRSGHAGHGFKDLKSHSQTNHFLLNTDKHWARGGELRAAHAMALVVILGATVGLAAYAYWLNSVLTRTPPEVKEQIIPTLTDEEVKKTWQRIEADGIPWEKALPARLDRRYIVVGGSGMCLDAPSMFAISCDWAKVLMVGYRACWGPDRAVVACQWHSGEGNPHRRRSEAGEGLLLPGG